MSTHISIKNQDRTEGGADDSRLAGGVDSSWEFGRSRDGF